MREELLIELHTLLHSAREKSQPVSGKWIDVHFSGHRARVSMDARPALDSNQDGFVLVIFNEQPIPTEPQSTNEELRSTMEELETSKELQSMNEELQTVNQENRHKVEELAQLSSDLQNLLAATHIATLFLDRDLRILRFTPAIGELFNFRMADLGRTLSDFTHRLGYDEMLPDCEQVRPSLPSIQSPHQRTSPLAKRYRAHLLRRRRPTSKVGSVGRHGSRHHGSERT